MSENEKRCCGTCRWHYHDAESDDWVCVNDNSDYVTDYTDYEDTCEEWEGRR